MPSWLRNVTAGAAGQVPTILTLAVLGGLAFWGARNDWRLAPQKEDDSQKEEKPAAVKVVRPPDGAPAGEPASLARRLARIEFPSAEAVAATGIKDAPAETRPMTFYVTANGMLDYEPYRYAQLAPRAPGTIWRMDKVMGEAVRKGELLALIESADVGRAKADFLQDLAQVDIRTKVLQRLRSAGGSVPEGTLREAENALREARLRLFNDQQRLLNLGLPLRLEDVADLSEDRQVRFLRLLGLPEAARRGIDPETVTANLLPVTAPFDGQVVRHPRGAPGEVADTTHPLFTIGDTSHLHIDLDVNLEDVAHLRVGQQVTFTPEDRSGEPATGELAHISPEVNEKTRHVQVHAEVENPDGRLRPNTYGTGRIRIRHEPQAVAVPSEAVQWEVPRDGPRSFFVFVRLSDTVFEVRPVTPGIREGNFTQVTGLEPGERVATVGSHVLKSELLKEKIAGGEE